MTFVGKCDKIDKETQNVFRGSTTAADRQQGTVTGKVSAFFVQKIMRGENVAKINGEDFKEKITIGEYLKKAGYSAVRVAVMVNGEILPKNDYDSTEIQPDDEVEIVGFVGGG